MSERSALSKQKPGQSKIIPSLLFRSLAAKTPHSSPAIEGFLMTISPVSKSMATAIVSHRVSTSQSKLCSRTKNGLVQFRFKFPHWFSLFQPTKTVFANTDFIGLVCSANQNCVREHRFHWFSLLSQPKLCSRTQISLVLE